MTPECARVRALRASAGTSRIAEWVVHSSVDECHCENWESMVQMRHSPPLIRRVSSPIHLRASSRAPGVHRVQALAERDYLAAPDDDRMRRLTGSSAPNRTCWRRRQRSAHDGSLRNRFRYLSAAMMLSCQLPIRGLARSSMQVRRSMPSCSWTASRPKTYAIELRSSDTFGANDAGHPLQLNLNG